MNRERLISRLSSGFETVVVVVLQLTMMLVIAAAIADLIRLLLAAIGYHWLGIGVSRLISIESVGDLQRALQRAFGGVLLVLLGLELLDTLRTYFDEHRLRLEIILVVAVIAVGRHVILLDFDHLNGLTLIGIATVLAALTSGYFIVRKAALLDRAQKSNAEP